MKQTSKTPVSEARRATKKEHISQDSHVFRASQLPSIDRGSGARTTPLVTAARGATSFLNGITEFDPGAKIGHHIHNVAESVMVITGQAIVDIDGDRTTLETYNTTFVPANIPHHFENASETEPMAIFWTYGSLDSTRTLLETGAHGRIDDEHPGGIDGAVHPVQEHAEIRVKPGHEQAFEAAVARAVPLFQQAAGARTMQLNRSQENPQTYHLFVTWDTIEAHTVDFRESTAFREWRELIADHIMETPTVTHLKNTLTGF